MNKRQIILVIIIISFGSIIFTLALIDPNNIGLAFKEDQINKILSASHCSTVEKIYNDNNKAFFPDKLVSKYSKTRLDLGEFQYKDCKNNDWNK